MRTPDFKSFCALGWMGLLITALTVQVAGAAQTAEIIQLHYADRPPYAVSGASDEPEGAVATVTAKVFRQANIPFAWEKTPVNRQFAILKENKGLNCAIGFEKTEERERFGKFTKPVYVSQPLIAITSLKVNEKNGVTLTHMLSKYTILVKENYTQGAIITKLIANSSNKYVTSVESPQMVQMIARARADFMLLSNDELEYYVKHGVIDSHDIHVLMLSDVNLRFSRRIMCSKSVSDQVIEKLDRVIATLHVQPAPYKSVVKP
ncbi:MAG: substrate-binding periplasmic protein [Bdellovibrionia bacterium]